MCVCVCVTCVCFLWSVRDSLCVPVCPQDAEVPPWVRTRVEPIDPVAPAAEGKKRERREVSYDESAAEDHGEPPVCVFTGAVVAVCLTPCRLCGLSVFVCE